MLSNVAVASAIEAHGLTKSFGLRPALRGVDLTVERGQCLALFGPNGAGKTTLLKVLAGIMNPSSGTLSIAGMNPKDRPEACRRKIGVVSHQTFLYGNLTGRENLTFYCRMFGVRPADERIGQVAEMVGMSQRLHDRVATLSRGMQQRLSIARALLHRPEIMLLDEPETGLDQQALGILWQVLRQEGLTVVLTSHSLERGLQVADRVLIMARGRLVHDCRRDSLAIDTLRQTYEQCTGAAA